jgi:hypothetical protein
LKVQPHHKRLSTGKCHDDCFWPLPVFLVIAGAWLLLWAAVLVYLSIRRARRERALVHDKRSLGANNIRRPVVE